MSQMRKSCSGQELVEYAIVFPVLMLLLLGIIEFGRIIYSYNAIYNAAREGARLAVIPSSEGSRGDVTEPCDAATNEIIMRVCERALALDQAKLQVTLSLQYPAGEQNPDALQVEVEYRLDLLTGLAGKFAGKGLLLQTAATMRFE